MNSRPVAIELFAGGGGLALGLQLSGIDVRCLVDIDEYCCQTLQHNSSKYFPRARILRMDARHLSASCLMDLGNVSRGEVDVVSGGPPCQSFSLSTIPKGGRLTDDPRDKLLLHFVRLVRGLAPAVFIFENVPGLLSKNAGSTFTNFRLKMEKLGYNITHSILNALDFGVPQHRRRLIVLGSIGKVPDFPFPSVQRSGTRWPEKSTIAGAFSLLTRDLSNQQIPSHKHRTVQLFATISQGSVWKHWKHRDKWTSPSRCITAHCRDEWVHPLEPRTGTVREMAVLQTFPLDYVFRGPVSLPHNHERSSQYRQVGNAVPVLMAKAIGEAVAGHLAKG